MNEAQKTLAKGVLFGIWLRKNNHLVKAYICLTAASVYGIRAARDANDRVDEIFEDLNTERQRPVMEITS